MSGRGSSHVVVALSGGVDSAVAALRLAREGYRLTAITLRLERGPIGPAADQARRVAESLGVPFRVIDGAEPFERFVVDYLVAAYGAGRTPNPCVACNRHVKFGFLWEEAQQMGADLLATGHYARIRQAEDAYQLLRGCDRAKDQSYFLHTLTQQQLAHVLFPIGDLTKEHVRELAQAHTLPVAEQPESQDLCFLAGEDYRDFLARRAPELFQPGPIWDVKGRQIGQHEGLPGYTIGQRKGLNVTASEPMYVLAIIPQENGLVVGPASQLGRSECTVNPLHIISGERRTRPFRAVAQIRYRAQPAPVTVIPSEGTNKALVRFDAEQRDITPGQFLVLYDGDRVLGGGVIEVTGTWDAPAAG